MFAPTGFQARLQGALRLLGIAAGRPLVGPRTVGLEITHYCNLACGFCETHGRMMELPIIHRRHYEGGRRTMDLDTIRRLCRSLARLGIGWVELSGKGDPIVHPQLAAIIGIIKDAGLRCSMYTNGTVPRPGLAATMVERGMDRLNISLNAATREVYARVVGKDLLDKALGFLTEVLTLRRQAGARRPEVRLSFVVCKDNVEDMEPAVQLCCDQKVDEAGFCVMGELRETTQLQLDADEVARLRAGIPAWSRRLEEAGVSHDLAGFAQDLRLRVGSGIQQENPLQRSIPCYEGWMHTVISPDGVVAPCCYCEGEPLGNIVEQDFADIWRGPRYADLRRRSLAMARTQESICWECYTTCNRALENQKNQQRLHTLHLD